LRKKISNQQLISAQERIETQLLAKAQVDQQTRHEAATKLVQKQRKEQEENEKIAQQLESLEDNDQLL
jgi:hypothetical protein